MHDFQLSFQSKSTNDRGRLFGFHFSSHSLALFSNISHCSSYLLMRRVKKVGRGEGAARKEERKGVIVIWYCWPNRGAQWHFTHFIFYFIVFWLIHRRDDATWKRWNQRLTWQRGWVRHAQCKLTVFIRLSALGACLIFELLGVGAYSRFAVIRRWALIICSPIQPHSLSRTFIFFQQNKEKGTLLLFVRYNGYFWRGGGGGEGGAYSKLGTYRPT